MSDDDVDTLLPDPGPELPITFPKTRRRGWPLRRRRRRPPKPRVRKLRLLLILLGLAALAFVSTVFGMMMAVASDLPQLENSVQYRHSVNSYLLDDQGRTLGILAPPNNVVIVKSAQIATAMKDAIIAVEDKRFYTNSGVDLRGIGRAFVNDVIGGGPRQGASTIEQQFVKNALSEQNNRTVFEKLREAALAYHLARKWPKDKILTEYLNSIYFGNGAYGVESAARVYFGDKLGFDRRALPGQGAGCGDSTPGHPLPECVSVLAPYQAALLAGMVASPSLYDPLQHPVAARRRRNLVLLDMYQQHYITYAQYQQDIGEPLPTAADIQHPEETTAAPYFTSWLTPQILEAVGRNLPPSVGAYRAYYGGLTIKTTLDLSIQDAAQAAINNVLPAGYALPSAALVAIDNKTGEVRAMVSGADSGSVVQAFQNAPFNLATQGERQPGSSFKPFTLAMAIESGQYGPGSIIDSAPQDFIVPNSAGKEHFIVHNFGNTYSGPISLAAATAISDNSVYSQVGIHVGTSKIARLARVMGVRTPVSNNYAMILGGLRTGVSPLDMAHAYETLAEGGQKVFNPELGAPEEGPIGIEEIQCPQKPVRVCNRSTIVNHPTYKRVLPAWVAKEVHDILTGVVEHGTGTKAAISGVDVVGKTGTTSNYGDAWFVGWSPQITAAVWVGFPNGVKSMATMYNGQPVEGGTYPAIIWHEFMVQALQIYAQEAAAAAARKNGGTSTTTTDTTGSSTPLPPASSFPGTSNAGGTATTGTGAGTGAGGGTGATGGTGGGTGASGGGANGGTGATGGGTGATGGGTGGGTGATGGGTGGGTGATGGTGGGGPSGGTGGVGIG